MAMGTMVDVVDKDDNVIGQIPESQVHKNHDVITRSVNVLLYNSKGELLLQKRSKMMYRFPLHWTVSASGSVDSGEEPVGAALRELKEEVGIEAKKEGLTFLFKKYIEADIKQIVYVYKIAVKGFKPVSSPEVAGTQYVSVEKIKKLIKEKEKFTPFFLAVFNSAHG